MNQIKKLYLVRHGKAGNFNTRLPDIDRPLTETGVTESYEIARSLKSSGINADVMITSPGIRALSTAMIFARDLGMSPQKVLVADELYEISTVGLKKFISGISNQYHEVMLFGHNPAFSDLASELKNASVHLPTAAVIAFSWESSHWKEIDFNNAALKMFIYPK